MPERQASACQTRPRQRAERAEAPRAPAAAIDDAPPLLLRYAGSCAMPRDTLWRASSYAITRRRRRREAAVTAYVIRQPYDTAAACRQPPFRRLCRRAALCRYAADAAPPRRGFRHHADAA